MNDAAAAAPVSSSRRRVDAATVGDLVLFCRNRTVPELPGMPAPWECLVAELVRAGFLTSCRDLAGLAASSDRRLLDREVPADIASRVVATLGVRYQAKDGYLYRLNNAGRWLSAVEAFDLSDLKTIIRAAGRGGYDRPVPIPGQGWPRVLRRVRWSAMGLAAVLVSPVFFPVLVIGFTANYAVSRLRSWRAGSPGPGSPDGAPLRRRRARAGPATSARSWRRLFLTGPVTNRQLEGAAVRAAFAWIPGVAVLAWFAERALRIPPHGPLGPVVTLLLAGTLSTVALVTIFFLMFGLAMDATPSHDETARMPPLGFLGYFAICSGYILFCDGALLALMWLASLAFK